MSQKRPGRRDGFEVKHVPHAPFADWAVTKKDGVGTMNPERKQ